MTDEERTEHQDAFNEWYLANPRTVSRLRLIYTVACPYCQAEAGDDCRNAAPHNARYRAYLWSLYEASLANLQLTSPDYFYDDEPCGYCQRRSGDKHESWCRQ